MSELHTKYSTSQALLRQQLFAWAVFASKNPCICNCNSFLFEHVSDGIGWHPTPSTSTARKASKHCKSAILSLLWCRWTAGRRSMRPLSTSQAPSQIPRCWRLLTGCEHMFQMKMRALWAQSRGWYTEITGWTTWSSIPPNPGSLR
jgi:hypothetical protein